MTETGTKYRHYLYLDAVRVMAAVAAALHMLGLLDGGWLAVCTLMVLAGYLAARNAFAQEKYSVWRGWLRALLGVWLPVAAVACLTVLVVKYIPNIIWLDLKPETLSVIEAINNYWQAGAGRDAFADLFRTPFTPMWAAAMMVQLAVLFPLVFVIFRALGDKAGRAVPCWVLAAVSALSFVSFGILARTGFMRGYYSTFARLGAPLLGMTAAFIQHYYGGFIPRFVKNRAASIIILCVYTAAWVYIVGFAGNDAVWTTVREILKSGPSDYFLKMLLVTLISVRMTEYAALASEGGKAEGLKTAGAAGWGASYGFLLLISPLAFLAPYVLPGEWPVWQKLCAIAGAAVIGGLLLRAGTDIRKGAKALVLRIVLLALIVGGTGYAGYQFLQMEDKAAQLAGLSDKLEASAASMEEANKAYMSRVKANNEKYAADSAALAKEKEELPAKVRALPIVGLGDSVMVGGKAKTLELFPNGIIDAKIGDTAYPAPEKLRNLIKENKLGSPVILNYGANGDVRESTKVTIMELIGDRPVYWLTHTVARRQNINDSLRAFAAKYSNIKVVDWYALTRKHPEYFVADGIHLTAAGQAGFAKVIYDAIYEDYEKELAGRIEACEKARREDLASRISFFGNDLLAETYDALKAKYPNADFEYVSNERFAELRDGGSSGFIVIKDLIQTGIKNGTLANKVVLLFDTMSGFGENEYKELAELCKDRQLHIAVLSGDLLKTPDSMGAEAVSAKAALPANEAGAGVIELRAHSAERDLMLSDRIHLTDEGCSVLAGLITEKVK